MIAPTAASNAASTKLNSPTWPRPTASCSGRSLIRASRASRYAGTTFAPTISAEEQRQPAEAGTELGRIDQRTDGDKEENGEEVAEGQQLAPRLA